MSEPAKQATAVNPINAVAHFHGLARLIIISILGFRSQSLAPPQALCLRPLSRAKAHPLSRAKNLQRNEIFGQSLG